MEVYDRSGLIQRSVHTLTQRLLEEFLIVGIVCSLCLLHFRLSLVVIMSLPLSVLVAFAVTQQQGLTATSCPSVASPLAPWWMRSS